MAGRRGVLEADVSQRALGVCGVHVDEGAQELVATVADDQVVRANPFADRGDGLDENMVSGRVTLGVVHVLEAVDVEEDDRDALAADAAGPVDLALQGGKSRTPPERAGEVVGGSDLGELVGVRGHSTETVERCSELSGVEVCEHLGLEPERRGQYLARDLDRKPPAVPKFRLRGPSHEIAGWRLFGRRRQRVEAGARTSGSRRRLADRWHHFPLTSTKSGWFPSREDYIPR